MAISNFIPEVWSETMLHALDASYVGVANCNRSFEGDIREKGNIVRICGLVPVTVSDYVRNTDISAPSALTDTVKELEISQAKYFNFQLDDADRVQSRPELMKLATHSAATALAVAADSYVYSMVKSAGKVISLTPSAENDLIHAIIDARTVLFGENVTDANMISVEVAPAVAALLLKEKASLSTDNLSSLENGCIGSVAGCRVCVSNQILSSADATAKTTTYRCIVRSNRAIAFAEQLSEVEAYRPESRFADAVKGLHLYGAKVVYPQELVELKVTLPTA